MQFRRVRDLWLHQLGLSRTFDPRILLEKSDARLSCLLELAIAERLLTSTDFFFLQIGAFDGSSFDPMFQAVRKHKLKGILVEPQKAAFARLQANYQDQPQLTLVNAAVSNKNEERILYTARGGQSTVASFDKHHLLKHSVPAAEIEEQLTPCFTVEELLRRAGRSEIDLLQIDAEGADYMILEMIDFQKVRPAIVRYEQLHMSRRERDLAARRLVSQGYQLHADRMDVTALQRAA